MIPLGAENVLEKLTPSNTPILTVKGALEDVWASPSKAKSFVIKRPNKPILIVQGPPVIIRPVSQLPTTNPKAVPSNYEPTVVTYKGKEIDEEIDEVGGITRSRRCYVLIELWKTKNDQIQIKSSVTEGGRGIPKEDETIRLLRGGTIKKNFIPNLFVVFANTF